MAPNLYCTSIPASENRAKSRDLVSEQAWFSLHAVVACKSNQPKKLERLLCRYITRPAISEKRLSLASNSNLIVALKTPWHEYVIPTNPADDQVQVDQLGNKAYSMTWAQRLKRVFSIAIETCEKCGGRVQIYLADYAKMWFILLIPTDQSDTSQWPPWSGRRSTGVLVI